MEVQVHQLERQAYFTVLLAFKAQADTLSWDKEGLMTDLREELKLSDDEHRELLAKASADKFVRDIREFRRNSNQPVYDVVPTSPVPVLRKRQKTILLSTAFPVPSSKKPMQYSPSIPAVTRPPINRDSSSALLANENRTEAVAGRRVWTRWPEDNNFYEAVIDRYDPSKGQHALVYDRGTDREAWEWVDINEIPPEDIRWNREDTRMGNQRRRRRLPSRENRSSQNLGGMASGSGSGRGMASGSGSGRGMASGSRSGRGMASGSGSGRGMASGSRSGRGMASGSRRCRGRGPRPRSHLRLKLDTSQVGTIMVDDIQLYHTEALAKEVEKVVDANPDRAELAKTHKVLKDQEQALMDALSKALSKLSSYASEGESGNNYMCN